MSQLCILVVMSISFDKKVIHFYKRYEVFIIKQNDRNYVLVVFLSDYYCLFSEVCMIIHWLQSTKIS